MGRRGEKVYRLVRLVRPMTLNSARVVARGLQEHGLTVGMRAVMEVVTESGPVAVPEVARALDVTRQAAQRLVNELVAAGHVRLVANPRHQRSSLVELMPRGVDAFEAVRAEELRQLATLAPEVSDADLETAHRVLSAVARDIRERALADD